MSEYIIDGGKTILQIFAGIIIVLFLGTFIMSFVSTAQAHSAFNNPEIQTYLTVINNYPVIFDWLVLFIYVLALVVSAYLAYIAPADLPQLILGYVLTIIMVFIGVLSSFLLNNFLNNAALATVVGQLSIIPIFANYMWGFVLLYVGVVMFALHSHKED